jgi:hypothetical protein
LVCQTIGDHFFLFCQNYIHAKLVCQTVGVALMSVSIHSTDMLRVCSCGQIFFFLPLRSRTVLSYSTDVL